MNLLELFIAGEAIVKIHSNEEANRLSTWVRDNVQGASSLISKFTGDDYDIFPETVVEQRQFGDSGLILNGYRPGILKSRSSFSIRIDYADLLPYLEGVVESDEPDIKADLKEVL